MRGTWEFVRLHAVYTEENNHLGLYQTRPDVIMANLVNIANTAKVGAVDERFSCIFQHEVWYKSIFMT